MKRALCFALLTAILAAGSCLAQAGKDSNHSTVALRQRTIPTLLAAFQQAPAAQQAPVPGAPVQAGANPAGARGGGFGGPIQLGPDDKPAFPDPPAGFNEKRENIPHGELKAVQYDSKTLGTRREIRVYTPPGYSTSRKYPVLYLLHGMGWNDLEWTQIRHADVVIDNLLADGKIQPLVMVFPNGDSSMTAAAIEAAGGTAWMGNGRGGPAPADAVAAGRGAGMGAGTRGGAEAAAGAPGAGTRGGAEAVAGAPGAGTRGGGDAAAPAPGAGMGGGARGGQGWHEHGSLADAFRERPAERHHPLCRFPLLRVYRPRTSRLGRPFDGRRPDFEHRPVSPRDVCLDRRVLLGPGHQGSSRRGARPGRFAKEN